MSGVRFSGDVGKRIRVRIARAVTVVAVGAATVLMVPATASAAAAGTPSTSPRLSMTVAPGISDTLTASDVDVVAPGPADVRRHASGQVRVSFPIASAAGAHGSPATISTAVPVALSGALAFSGTSTTTWRDLRMNPSTGDVSASINGRRALVLDLSVRAGRGDQGTHQAVYRLTPAGAGSVNTAAGEPVTRAGAVFASLPDGGC